MHRKCKRRLSVRTNPRDPSQPWRCVISTILWSSAEQPAALPSTAAAAAAAASCGGVLRSVQLLRLHSLLQLGHVLLRLLLVQPLNRKKQNKTNKTKQNKIKTIVWCSDLVSIAKEPKDTPAIYHEKSIRGESGRHLFWFSQESMFNPRQWIETESAFETNVPFGKLYRLRTECLGQLCFVRIYPFLTVRPLGLDLR